MAIIYSRHSKFSQQLKKLLKKYRTLEDDLAIAEKAAIELLHLHRLDNRSVELVPGFDHEVVKIYKIKKFACKSLPGKGVRSGIRVIYAFLPKKMEIVYLEIYYKEKSNTDMNYNFAKSFMAEIEKNRH
jgi:hypothetical protein